MMIDQFDAMVRKVAEKAQRRTNDVPEEFTSVFTHLLKAELFSSDKVESIGEFRAATAELPDCISLEKAVNMLSLDLGNHQTSTHLTNVSRSLKQLAVEIDEIA